MVTRLMFGALCMVVLGGCMATRSVELAPAELQSQIRSGALLSEGDWILLVTESETLRMRFVRLDEEAIHGTIEDSSRSRMGHENKSLQAVAVPIDEVVAMKTQQLQAGRTALLVGGSVGVLYIIAAAVAGAAILAAAAP